MIKACGNNLRQYFNINILSKMDREKDFKLKESLT